MDIHPGSLSQALAALDAAEPAALDRLFALLRIPSISTDPAYAPHCRRTAEALAAMLTELGFTAAVHETGGHPAVLGHAPKPGAPHVLFYGHYDVQPVDPENLWTTPPFEPRLATLQDGRQAITARGAADDKGQVMTFLEACRAWRTATGDLPLGITVLIEGEEEDGSKHLPAFLEAHRADLAADLALVCDTGMWNADTPAVTIALRGLAYLEVTVEAADRDLHSGIFGGAAANPIHVLSRILAALHDETGRITLPGFYDGVAEPDAATLAQWRALDLTPATFLGPIGLAHPVGERDRLLIEMIQSRPTADVNGIWGGYTGEGAKTVIPARASAKISFRLVGDQDPDAVATAFETFVQSRLPADCRAHILRHKGSRAITLPATMPALAAARRALAEEWGREPVLIGAGGSIPIVGDFKRTLGLDTLLIGFGLDDDRVHSPNEKYDLRCFRQGARSWVRVLGHLAGAA
jgi:acetylornithine deacetylase/succinyl-diaminopimelate desuccinylase-like protein